MLKEYQKIPTLYKFDLANHEYLNQIDSPEVEYLRSLPWLASEKYDGTNIRVYYDGYRVTYHGRTDKAQIPFNVQSLLDKFFSDSEVVFEQNFQNKEVILFMECYGGLVQGSKKRHWYEDKEETLIGFDVMVDGNYLRRQEIKEVFNIFNVPCIEQKLIPSLDEAIRIVKSKTEEQDNNPDTPYFEGLVLVPEMNLYTHYLSRIIVKVKCDTFRIMKGIKRPSRIKAPKNNKPQKKKIPTQIFDVETTEIKLDLESNEVSIPTEYLKNSNPDGLVVIKKGGAFMGVYKISDIDAEMTELTKCVK